LKQPSFFLLGFSFTDDDAGYAKNQTDVARDLYSALQQFFTLFPELQKNEFFVTGESYAGKKISKLNLLINRILDCSYLSSFYRKVCTSYILQDSH
jgi:carboxypeptidase C (cathepsin A)